MYSLYCVSFYFIFFIILNLFYGSSSAPRLFCANIFCSNNSIAVASSNHLVTLYCVFSSLCAFVSAFVNVCCLSLSVFLFNCRSSFAAHILSFCVHFTVLALDFDSFLTSPIYCLTCYSLHFTRTFAFTRANKPRELQLTFAA